MNQSHLPTVVSLRSVTYIKGFYIQCDKTYMVANSPHIFCVVTDYKLTFMAATNLKKLIRLQIYLIELLKTTGGEISLGLLVDCGIMAINFVV